MRDKVCGVALVRRSLNLRLVLQQSADAAISKRLIMNTHGMGNLLAFFIMGMRVIFRQHGGALDVSHDNLDRAARRGHKPTAFLLAMLLWRANRAAEHDLRAKELLAEAADDHPALAILNDRGVGLYTSTSWTRCGGTCGLTGTRPCPCLGQCHARFTSARPRTRCRSDGSMRAGAASPSAMSDGTSGRTTAVRNA